MEARSRRPDFGIVFAVLVVVALGAAGVLLAESQSGWFAPSGCGSSACGNSGPPVSGATLALGRPVEATVGGNHWYNFTVEFAEGGVLFDDLHFQVVSASGANVTPGEGWSLAILGSSGALAASFVPVGSYWASGAPGALENSQMIALGTGTMDLSGQGMALVVLGFGTFEGSSYVSIP